MLPQKHLGLCAVAVAQRRSMVDRRTYPMRSCACLLRKGGAVTGEATRTINQARVQRFPGSAGQAEREPSEAGYSEPLTGREEELLQLLVQGVTTTHELAASLLVSDNTVKFHLRNILDKLHLHNRAAVVAHATRRPRLDRAEGLNLRNFEPLSR